MIDEEMAKDYANEYVPLIAPIDDRIYQVTKEDIIKILKDCSIDSYIDGLKAGRPKWHKVADGDLPSEEGGWVCNQNGLPCYYDWGTEQWLDCEGTQIRTTEWCHMPHKE